MQKENSLMSIAVIVIAAALVFMVFRAPAPTQVSVTTPEGLTNVLRTDGYFELEVAPDQAEMSIAVETNHTDAKTAQQRNADISNAVRAALKSAGIRDEDIGTTNYNVYETRECDPAYWRGEGGKCSTFYRVSNTVKIKSKQLSMIGDYIDAAVSAGANRVDSLQFTLSKEKRADVQAQALREASKEARKKAEAMADSLGITLGGIARVSESSFGVTPVYYARDMMAKAESAGAPAAPTPISPEDVKVTAQVSVEYQI